MDAIRYVEYRNRHPAELDDAIFDAVWERDRNIMSGYVYPVPVAEFVLRAVRQQPGWLAEVTEWESAAAHWIPPRLQAWWYDQLDKNPGMDNMPPEWWQTQALGMVAAWHDDRPVGAVSLTTILAGDRGMHDPGRPLFNEIRGLVVDPQFRASVHKIGTHLVRRVVGLANRLQGDSYNPLATIAITSNPRAAALFMANGAVDDPSLAGIPISQRGAKAVACWRQWQGHNWPATEPCDVCPTRDNRLWMWPTTTEWGQD